ncbi:hypothetical protein CCR94_20890 [Rhodoblastus sphagnicola]|uniref:Uncharacterized protein n=1 Tax=Rhodoblastus sphagnicola TaxID=333368 RepID=A0A2S6MXN9_9HYPH|nr:nuclear transport factor 2 family protein [Rhodoblastus sphagnicola]MBB4196783.1 ketosteroid isomerase-like protein [Rhodoblastus sphagnicola]PPQ27132.1 hypothetical protein CCR94_20890 [Rhodoblastus sphagnicola]
MSDSEGLTPAIDRAKFEEIISTLLASRPSPRQIISCFADDAEWRLHGEPANWSYAGLRRGRESVLAFLKAFAVEFQQLGLRRLATVIDNDQACIQYDLRVRHRGTHREDTIPCLCFIRLEGALIAEVNEFVDSARLFALRESRY